MWLSQSPLFFSSDEADGQGSLPGCLEWQARVKRSHALTGGCYGGKGSWSNDMQVCCWMNIIAKYRLILLVCCHVIPAKKGIGPPHALSALLLSSISPHQPLLSFIPLLLATFYHIRYLQLAHCCLWWLTPQEGGSFPSLPADARGWLWNTCSAGAHPLNYRPISSTRLVTPAS